jgi:hypothetical protein
MNEELDFRRRENYNKLKRLRQIQDGTDTVQALGDSSEED